MVDVIVDTSSLLSFALIFGQYRGYGDTFNTPSIFDYALLNAPYRPDWIGFENTIEAVVLYDNLLLDGASFHRCKQRVPELALFEQFSEILSVNHSEEKEYYKSIEVFYKSIKGNKETPGLTNLLAINRPLMEEVEDLEKCMSRSVWEWEYIEEYLPNYLREIANSLKAIMGEYTPNSSAALIAILRIFYYQALQLAFNTDLLLHPWKGHHYNGLYKAKVKNGIPSPASIVGMFDSTVRDKYLRDHAAWLGGGVSVKYPILTHYILTKAAVSWKNVLDICMELRNSNKAQNFRKEINYLRDAIDCGNRIAVNELVSSLENQAIIWSKNLDAPISPTREIAFSIPLFVVNPEFKLNVPIKRMRRKYPGEKILIFMHELLQYSI